jgi:2-oxoisovalerate dehydrogenase E1 component
MRKLGLISPEGIAAVREQAAGAMRLAAAQLVEPDPSAGKPGRRRIRPELWPDPAFADVGIRGDLSEIAGARTAERSTFTGALRPAKLIDAVAAVMDRRMGDDRRIVVLGEDVHKLNGGTNGATKGLPAKYPGRVLGTPISENAFAGLGGGLALDGRFRPVVEFMYPDFLWVAADQVFNQVGRARHMFGGRTPVPLVLRTKVAMGTGYGSQHSMDPAGIFATSPGWRIMAPSTPFDYIGMMNAALAIGDPVLVLEHVDLYGTDGDIPVDDLDYQVPFGTAAIRREGRDVTVLAYLSMVEQARLAIEQTGIDAELIDLRFLDRASLDWQAVGASIRKTGAVLIVEQGARGTSYGGWLADEVQRRFFDWLDQPVQRVTGGEASPSISRILERAAIARAEEVVAGLERVRQGFGGAPAGGAA